MGQRETRLRFVYSAPHVFFIDLVGSSSQLHIPSEATTPNSPLDPRKLQTSDLYPIAAQN